MRILIHLGILFILFDLSLGGAEAQVTEEADAQVDEDVNADADAEEEAEVDVDAEEDGDEDEDSGAPFFTGLPIISVNPTVDFGFGLMAMAGYRVNPNDEISPHSMSMVGGMYSTNKTWIFFVGQKLFFDEDNWRLAGGFGIGTFNYDYFGQGDLVDLGLAFPVSQGFRGLVLKAERRVWDHLYLGLWYRWIYADLFVEIPDELPGDYPPLEVEARQSGLGVVTAYDSRDKQLSATEGIHAELKTSHYREWLGSDDEYDIYELFANYYLPIRSIRHILAFRTSGRFTVGDAPAYELSVIGSGPDLRGYQFGRYRDNVLLAAQVEYRWNFWWRFGAVAFVGLGSVVQRLGDLGSGTPLPSVGLGLRFNAVPRERVMLRFDYAWGRDEGAFYLGIGEAF